MESHTNGIAENKSTLINAPQLDGLTTPSGGAPVDDTSIEADGRFGSTAKQLATLACSSSSNNLNQVMPGERLPYTSCVDIDDMTPLCRICYQEAKQEELTSPCRCSGSVQYTHQHCLIKWLREGGSRSCELCHYEYQIVITSTKKEFQWEAVKRKMPAELFFILGVFYHTFFIIHLLYFIVFLNNSTATIFLVVLYIFSILFFVIILLCDLRRGGVMNQQWEVLNFDKAKDSKDQKAGTALGPSS